jgi:FemAB family protein
LGFDHLNNSAMYIIDSSNENFVKYCNNTTHRYFEGVMYSALNIKYSKLYSFSSKFIDLSLIVVDGNWPVLTLIMSLETQTDGVKIFNGYGRPICYIESEDYDKRALKIAFRLLKKKFDKIIEKYKPNAIFYKDYLRDSNLSHFGRYLMDIGAKAEPYFTQILNLAQPETELKQNLRKSYKSLLNWGEQNIRLRLLDSKNIIEKDIDKFRNLHFDVAGRETRPVSTWKMQYEMLKNNEGFVIIGDLDGKLVTAAYFNYNSVRCYYGVSVSLRELFDKPISHIVLWEAIIHSKKIGCKYFETGEQLYFNQANPTKKELGISKFKRGFGGASQVWLNIKLRLR